MSAYDKMIALSTEINDLENTLALLEWDERTCMPEGALPTRAQMNGTISGIHHRVLVSDEMKRCLEELNRPTVISELDDMQIACVREMKRTYDKRAKVPDKLVNKISRAASEGQAAWARARAKSDFSIFADKLELNVALIKELADYTGYENEPYDALLDDYEPGLTTARVIEIFDPMKKGLSKILKKISNCSEEEQDGLTGMKFSISSQKDLCRKIAEDIGFDFTRGRLDDALHPFTVGMNHEARITNRYNEDDLSSIYSLLHEAGHGMYEQGIDSRLYGTPVGKYISMGYHESQSRTWENLVGRNRSFLDYLYPLLVEYFPKIKDIEKESIHRMNNRVLPSYIRVEADEITYNLHIALRFDIEVGLFRDEISTGETEEIWKEKMDEYLGIVPDDPAEGVLQDIHWSAGAFGYFPSYTLGNLYAAQIFNSILRDHPDIHEQIGEGDFSILKGWLKEKIHRHGLMYTPEEMIHRLTSESLKPKYFEEYVEKKYGEIYGF